MLDDEAPGVCEHVWNLLPAEAKVIHGMYSGAEVFLMLDNPRPARQENLVQLPLPGELLYFYDQNIGAAGGRKPVAEIVVVYGRGVAFARARRRADPVPSLWRGFRAIGNMTGSPSPRPAAAPGGKARRCCASNGH